MSYVTWTTHPPFCTSTQLTCTVPAWCPTVTREYADVCAFRSMRWMIQLVSVSMWLVTKTVPGASVGASPRYAGSQRGTHFRSPSGVNKPIASTAGMGRENRPNAVRRKVVPFLGGSMGLCRGTRSEFQVDHSKPMIASKVFWSVMADLLRAWRGSPRPGSNRAEL